MALWICFSLLLLQKVIYAQTRQRFYYNTFEEGSLSQWTLTGTEGWNMDILSPSWSECTPIGDGTCVEITEGAISKNVPLTGYRSIRVVIDVRSTTTVSNEWCYLSYRASSTSLWTQLSVIGETIGNNIDYQVDLDAQYDDLSTFEIRLSSNAPVDAECYFDNLEIYGVPLTSSPTSGPTLSPTQITAAPTKPPTSNPSKSPSSSPSSSPSGSPTRQPTKSPTSFPSGFPSRSPTRTTKSPTSVPSKVPSVSPTSRPSEPPSGSPTSFPTKSPVSEGSVGDDNGNDDQGDDNEAVNAQNNASGSTGLPLGALVGIIVAGLCLLCIGVGLFYRQKRKSSNKDEKMVAVETAGAIAQSPSTNDGATSAVEFNTRSTNQPGTTTKPNTNMVEAAVAADYDGENDLDDVLIAAPEIPLSSDDADGEMETHENTDSGRDDELYHGQRTQGSVVQTQGRSGDQAVYVQEEISDQDNDGDDDDEEEEDRNGDAMYGRGKAGATANGTAGKKDEDDAMYGRGSGGTTK